ncbi:hypothetical protein Bbelb_347380 [Branchiostoma belcheri]|nr:hypothetical protein Bbelb_347380 [Branchiostoma belcheri]
MYSRGKQEVSTIATTECNVSPIASSLASLHLVASGEHPDLSQPHRVIMPPESPGYESTCLIAARAALPRLYLPASSPTCCKPTQIIDMLQLQSQLASQLLLLCTQPSL